MRTLVIIAFLGSLIAAVPAAPAENKDITFPLPWQTILLKGREYGKVLENTFDSMRKVCNEENTAVGFIVSEQVILAHRRTLGVIIEVLKKINEHRLTCKDIRFHSMEVIDIFLDIIRFLFNAEISDEGKARLRTIYVGTVLDSTKLVNQVATLLGCPRP